MISVVIPLYNKAHCIERTLNSVLTQTYQNFEIVIIDDGSSDDGVQKVEKFADARISIFQQENQGVSVARNLGVEKSKFEYIAFLDADDEWLPDYLHTMNNAIAMYPYASMYCCAGIIRNKSGEYSRLAKEYEGKIIEIDYFKNPHVFTHTSATIVSKKMFYKTQGFPPGMRLNQDFALFFSLALIAPVIYCGFKLSVYVGDVEGQTTKRSSDKNFNKEKYITDRINLCNSNWQNTDKKNKYYPIFEKYEIRSIIIGYLRETNYDALKSFLHRLSPVVKKNLSKLELWFYQKESLKNLSIVYIYFTKLIWRSKGFPRISYKKPNLY